MARLTHRKKIENFKIIVDRDGYRCFYCGESFSDNHPEEYDHLDNNEEDSRVENLVLAHHECNNKKKFNTDWQIKAMEKRKHNEIAVLACERRLADTGTTQELTSSQEISKANRPIAEKWIEEHLLMENEIILRDAVNAIVDICQKTMGSGSQAAVYRYIDAFCNPYTGKYTLSTNEIGKTIIRRRTEN